MCDYILAGKYIKIYPFTSSLGEIKSFSNAAALGPCNAAAHGLTCNLHVHVRANECAQ